MIEIVDLSTDVARFDFITMVREWRDFTESCGYDRPDAGLVGALAFAHSEVFRDSLDEFGIEWDDLEGKFIVDQHTLWVYGGFPFSREELEQVWANTFTRVAEQLGEIEKLLEDGQNWPNV